jgi:hypothetical protein
MYPQPGIEMPRQIEAEREKVSLAGGAGLRPAGDPADASAIACGAARPAAKRAKVAQIGAVVARVPFARQALPVDRSPAAPVLEGFSPTPEMRGIAEAQALMKSLP